MITSDCVGALLNYKYVLTTASCVYKTDFVTVTVNIHNRTGDEHYRTCINCNYNMYADYNDNDYGLQLTMEEQENPVYKEPTASRIVVLPHNYVFPQDFKALKNEEIFYGDVAVLGLHGDDGMDNTPENVLNLQKKSVREPIFVVDPKLLQSYGILEFPEISGQKPATKSDLKIVSWGMHSGRERKERVKFI